MTRENLLKRLQAIKNKGIEVIITSDHDMLDIPSNKLLDNNNIIIKESESFEEIETKIKQFEDRIERQESVAIFNYLKTNL